MSNDFKLSATLRGHEEDVSEHVTAVLLYHVTYPLYLIRRSLTSCLATYMGQLLLGAIVMKSS